MTRKNKKQSTGLTNATSASVIKQLLPAGLKKMLSKSRGSALVLFEENDHGKWSELLRGSEFLIAANSLNEKSFTINLAEHALDVYRSPHLLDLSKVRDLADQFKYRAESETKYRDLPGGAWMDKLGLFDFWDFNKSEIWRFFRQGYQGVQGWSRSLFSDPDLSTKLPGETKKSTQPESIIEQISIFKLILAVSDIYYDIYLLLRGVSYIWFLSLRSIFRPDETVWLNSAPVVVSEEKLSSLDRMIQAAASPTISELLAPHNVVKNEEKFKIIGTVSKKQVQDKYLQNNFSRSGVTVNIQPPSQPWPKDRFSWDLSNLVFAPATLKPIAVFLGVLIALTCSVKAMSYWDEISKTKGMVLGEAEQALTNINSAETGLKALDFNSAKDKFLAAQANFTSAQDQLNNIKSFITVLAEVAPAENTFKSGTNLIDMGEHLSNAANNLLTGVTAASGESDLSLGSRLKNLAVELDPALTELEAANVNAGQIGLSHLPAEHQAKFIQLRDSLPTAILALRQLKESAEFAVQVLGDNDLRRYLLIFQNDNELRATGGFMGSFALVDFKNGKIEKIVIPPGGTYDIIAGNNEVVAPPQPLQLTVDRWQFQDSNWWPDFPTSAKNIKWFYEKSGGPSVDGVITINSSFLGKLLQLTGPVNLPQYSKTITADNFEDELQKSIELEAKEKNKPKKILSELAPILLDRLLSLPPQQIFNLMETLNKGLAARDIQMYFNNDSLQNFAVKNNWAGALEPTPGTDYLSVVSTNILGGKTDNVIKQKIYHQAEIQADGSVIDRVLIARENIGPIDDFFTSVYNNSYLRIYVPAGSQLIQAVGFKGFTADKYKKVDDRAIVPANLIAENLALIDPTSGTKIYEENGKTVFANWTIAGPGDFKDLVLVYKLPFKVAINDPNNNIVRQAASLFSPEVSAYSLLFQKQSGRSTDDINSEVTYPSNLNLKLFYPETASIAGNKLIFTSKTDTDKFMTVGFTKKIINNE